MHVAAVVGVLRRCAIAVRLLPAVTTLTTLAALTTLTTLTTLTIAPLATGAAAGIGFGKPAAQYGRGESGFAIR